MPQLKDPKSRWQESEWWLTIVTISIGILMKLNVLSSHQGDLVADVANDVIALLLIIGPVIGWQFVRTKKKIAERNQEVEAGYLDQQEAEAKAKEDQPN